MLDLNTGTWRMLHVLCKASFEAEASDQSRSLVDRRLVFGGHQIGQTKIFGR
jgi:hypothetical protein